MIKYKNLILYTSIFFIITQAQSNQRQAKNKLIIKKNNLNIVPLVEKLIKNLNFTNKINDELKELIDIKNNNIQIDLSSIEFNKKLTNFVYIDAKLIGIKNIFLIQLNLKILI